MSEYFSGLIIYANNFEYLGAFYQQVLGFDKIELGEQHMILQRKGCQLTLLQRPDIQDPKSAFQEPSIKPIFVVGNLAEPRYAASLLGGHINSPRTEWQMDGYWVCDGVDSESNIFQLRAKIRDE